MDYRIHEKTTDEGWHLRTVVRNEEIIPAGGHLYLPKRDDLNDTEHSALEEAFKTGQVVTMGWTMVEPVRTFSFANTDNGLIYAGENVAAAIRAYPKEEIIQVHAKDPEKARKKIEGWFKKGARK